MVEKNEIKQSVDVMDNSKYRIALDLMVKIASYDTREKSEGSERKYWLTLFHQCLKATDPSNSLESIFREK
jgi:hypothetical protein